MGNFGQRVKALSFPPSPPQLLGSCSLKRPLTSSSGHLPPSKMIKLPFLLVVCTLPLPPQFDELCESGSFISEGSSPSCGTYGLQGFTEPWE